MGPGDEDDYWLVEPERGEEEEGYPILRLPASHFVAKATAAQALRYFILNRSCDLAPRWRRWLAWEGREIDWAPDTPTHPGA